MDESDPPGVNEKQNLLGSDDRVRGIGGLGFELAEEAGLALREVRHFLQDCRLAMQ